MSEVVSAAEVDGTLEDASLVETLEQSGIPILQDVVPEGDNGPGSDNQPPEDGLSWYFAKASRHALLSPEEEADLAKRYAAGRAAADILSRPGRLTTRDRVRLSRIAADGQRARDRLVVSNLRLVVPLARRLAGRDLDFVELIQEGNLGLLRAVEKFDHTRGYKFSTYAVQWIRQALQRGVADKARTVRVPLDNWLLVSKFNKQEDVLRIKFGRDPTELEVAESLGLDLGRVLLAKQFLRHPTSLDEPLSVDSSTSLSEVVSDTTNQPPEDAALVAVAEADLASLLDALPRDERQVVELRFGLFGDEPKTLHAVGQSMGLSRERVRQLQNSALSRLRHPSIARQIEQLSA